MNPKRFLKYYLTILSSGIILIYILFPLVNTIRTQFSKEYEVALDYIKDNSDLVQKIGQVKDFGNFPHTVIIKYSDGTKQTKIETKVIGEKSEIEVEIYMEQDWERKWDVKQIIIKDES
ncbi:hypothetical protein DVK85_11750 [Flavobacterium arcticum]|uniref:Uncharacterized protein n=1 Tax=Flavobacterium arcticum TaxID=1784713 RepID=A0A345HE54_9FLAO|nr:hypothetical protein [Flavobacterium arcticum]AXG74864.1 hypothetical protein DVK85_11750 [Flavobacterium arcticum]KAF2509638.1 hypothetical protein E0W72_08925 [Flavobacterium arcticum]